MLRLGKMWLDCGSLSWNALRTERDTRVFGSATRQSWRHDDSIQFLCRKPGAVLQIMVNRKENVPKMARLAPAHYQNCRWQTIPGSLSEPPKNDRQLSKKVEIRTALATFSVS